MVDDKVTLCFALREYFGLYNYHVDCAHNLNDATICISTSHYAAVITDLNLDGNLDGFKVMKMVQEQCPETRVIVLTAYGSAETESAALGCGVSAFLHKPKPLSEVARIIFELVGDNP